MKPAIVTKISTLHYIRCLSDPQMLDVYTQTFPYQIVKGRPEQRSPTHCAKCGSDELIFSRVEDYEDCEDGELLVAYKIHHVLCCKCSNDELGTFHWND